MANIKLETVLCGYCNKNQARKPSWGSQNKPICGDCFTDAMKRGDPDLYAKIAEHLPGYENQKK